MLTDRFAGRPVYDTAISHAILRRVAAGECEETIRLYVPDEVVVFSLLDSRRPGFDAARRAAADQGFGDVLRLAGGHAALFHGGCLAFSWATPDDGSACGIKRRFERMSGWWAEALGAVGLDARIGEVEGEYCPGEYSVNARGAIKLMGVGQRVIRGAAHVGGVVVIRDAPRVREVLEPVYRALEIDWRPDTAGAVEDDAPHVTTSAVQDAFLRAVEADAPWRFGALEGDAHELADSLVSWHDPAGRPGGLGPGRATASKKLVVAD